MQKKILGWIFWVSVLAFVLVGCGEASSRITDGSEAYTKREDLGEIETEDGSGGGEESVSVQKETELFVVTAIDEERKTMTLCDFESTRERPYSYTGATYIKGKYGNSMAVGQLSIGELVEIERKGDTLTNVQVSKEAFSYGDLHNFKLDLKNQVLTVGDSTYFLDENLLAYHGGSKVSLSEISEQDVICLKGMGNDVYTIQVIAGHGTVVLENTELFQGGYITIGNLLSQKIIPQMRIEVAEGTYLLAVANDGYGGSREITVEANKETVVNLDELKGVGPQFCKMQIKLEPENAIVRLDGKQINPREEVEVRYGTHYLSAEADGYVEWKRMLIVNSKTAKITINMTTEEDEEEVISTSNNSSGSSSNNSNNNTSTNNNSNRNTNGTGTSTNPNGNRNTNTNTNNNTNSNNNTNNNSNNNNTNNNSNNNNTNNNNNNNNTNNNNNNNNTNNNNNNNNNNTNNNNNNNNTNNNNNNSNNNGNNNNSNNNNNGNNNNNSNNNNDGNNGGNGNSNNSNNNNNNNGNNNENSANNNSTNNNSNDNSNNNTNSNNNNGDNSNVNGNN